MQSEMQFLFDGRINAAEHQAASVEESTRLVVCLL